MRWTGHAPDRGPPTCSIWQNACSSSHVMRWLTAASLACTEALLWDGDLAPRGRRPLATVGASSCLFRCCRLAKNVDQSLSTSEWSSSSIVRGGERRILSKTATVVTLLLVALVDVVDARPMCKGL